MLCFMQAHVSSVYSVGLMQGEHAKQTWSFINIHDGFFNRMTQLACYWTQNSIFRNVPFVLKFTVFLKQVNPVSPVRYPCFHRSILRGRFSKKLKLKKNQKKKYIVNMLGSSYNNGDATVSSSNVQIMLASNVEAQSPAAEWWGRMW